MKTLIAAITVFFTLSVCAWAQQAPRTLEQVQSEYSQLQAVYNNHNRNYNRGMEIVDRSMAGMDAAKTKMQQLIEEAKKIQASKPEIEGTEKAPVK